MQMLFYCFRRKHTMRRRQSLQLCPKEEKSKKNEHTLYCCQEWVQSRMKGKRSRNNRKEKEKKRKLSREVERRQLE